MLVSLLSLTTNKAFYESKWRLQYLEGHLLFLNTYGRR